VTTSQTWAAVIALLLSVAALSLWLIMRHPIPNGDHQ
jgi:hypothetical protein